MNKRNPKPQDIVIEAIKSLHAQQYAVYVEDVMEAIPATTLKPIRITETLDSLRVSGRITIDDEGVINWIVGEL